VSTENKLREWCILFRRWEEIVMGTKEQILNAYPNPENPAVNLVEVVDRASYLEAIRQRDQAIETLKFYADKFSWRTNSGKVGITPLTNGQDSEMIDDQWTNGKRARQTLKELETK
jgi:hypothetical protein